MISCADLVIAAMPVNMLIDLTIGGLGNFHVLRILAINSATHLTQGIFKLWKTLYSMTVRHDALSEEWDSEIYFFRVGTSD